MAQQESNRGEGRLLSPPRLGAFFLAFAIGILLGWMADVVPERFEDPAPLDTGVSEARLARITDYMNQAVSDGTMVGGLGLIQRRGQVVYEETYGQADREAGRPMTQDAIFRIYSMSKPITGVAVMMLHEEGRFFLNDPIAKYLPQLADLQVARATGDSGGAAMVSDGTASSAAGADGSGAEGGAEAAIQTRKAARQPTIRDLLTHTAGFTYGFFGQTEVDELYRQADLMAADKTMQDFVSLLAEIPLQYDPGSRWHYSVSVDVQGALVEAVSGMSFGEFLQTRLFGPLGMKDTSFVVPAEKWPRVAQLYSPKNAQADVSAFLQADLSDELVVADDVLNAGYREGAKFESGGGGLMSTVHDYLRFCQMMLNGGELDGVRILSPASVALMTTNHTGDLPTGFGAPGMGFGLGFAVALDQGQIGELGSVGEYSWGGAAGTRFWVDPAQDLIGIFMVQSIPHRTDLGQKFKLLTYQALED